MNTLRKRFKNLKAGDTLVVTKKYEGGAFINPGDTVTVSERSAGCLSCNSSENTLVDCCGEIRVHISSNPVDIDASYLRHPRKTDKV